MSKIRSFLYQPVSKSTAVVAALAVGIPMFLFAADRFADVPTGHFAHNAIGAVAGAGITTGCGTNSNGAPIYCPDHPVTRAQMAAFLHRSLGRVARTGGQVTIPTTEQAIRTAIITPPSATADGAGFLKADAAFTIWLVDATGCPCVYRGALYVPDRGDGQAEYMSTNYVDVTVTTANQRAMMAITGAVKVVGTAPKTVEVRIFRSSGGSTNAVAHGNATVSYFPFGSTGVSTLAAPAEVETFGAPELRDETATPSAPPLSIAESF